MPVKHAAVDDDEALLPESVRFEDEDLPRLTLDDLILDLEGTADHLQHMTFGPARATGDRMRQITIPAVRLLQKRLGMP